MKIFSGADKIPQPFPHPVLTMGNFDGVHRGHQYLFQLVRDRARHIQGTSVVLTFDPHPQRILSPEAEFFLINHVEEKIEIIRTIGIDVLICTAFTPEFAATPPRQFVADTLVQKLGVQEVYVGQNSRFGRQQQGTAEALEEWGEEFGFRVIRVPPVIHHGVVISSTKIRQLLRQGLVDEAAQLLNRPYAVDGVVIAGRQRGSTLVGYPTANLAVKHELIPKNGVYIGQVIRNQQRLPAVVSIGTNPTFQQQELVVEVHILDFHESVYGEHLKVEFLQRLRDERMFSAPHALAQQISRDVERTKAYFEAH
jgi:riboflavin kinase / FMN adenylyltransferase